MEVLFRSNSIGFFIIFVFLLQISGLERASGDAKNTFTIDELMIHIRPHNRDLQSAHLEVEIKRAAVGPSGAWEDPVLSYEFMNYPADTLSPRELEMTGRQISLSQKIPFWGKSGLLREIAEKEAASAEALAQEKEREIARDLRQHFLDLAFLYRKLDLFGEQSKILSQISKVARRQYETGKISQAELLAAQLEMAKAESEILRLKSQIDSIYSEFTHHTGGEDYFKGKRPQFPALSKINLANLTETRIQSLLNENNLRLKAQKLDAEARNAEVLFAKKANIPDLEIMGGYTMREPTMNDRGASLVSLKVGINLPIWSGHKQSEQIKSASHKESFSNNEYQKNFLDLQRSVQQIKTEMIEFRARMDLYEKSILDLAKMTVNSNRLNYLGNKVSFANYLQSLRSQKDAEIEYFEAKVSYEKKASELEAILGDLH